MSDLDRHELVIVGAGAAGLWAAARCAQGGAGTLLLEKRDRTGTKILASGGSRCNLTTTLNAERAGRLFGTRGERFLRPALRTLSPQDVCARFAELGVDTVAAPLEKVFPASQNARDVRDALESAARGAGCEIQFHATVGQLEPDSRGGWAVQLTNGATVLAERLLLSSGGQSYPDTGTTGDGYAWLRALDLEVVPPVPALVPLSSPEQWVRELTGVALQDCEVRLVDGSGKEHGRRARPLLFTHSGLSGPAAMDLSGIVAREHESAARMGAPPPRFAILVDLMPLRSREELRVLLIDSAARSGALRLQPALGGDLPRRLVAAVCRQAHVAPNGSVQDLSKSQRHEVIEALKGLRVEIDGTAGFDAAEVTRGGLALRECNPRTMQVNAHPGLYVCGELLDVDGPIGGLNFQSAFATAELAARHLTAAR